MGSYHGPHTPSLRCFRPLSWGSLIQGSYHGPHTPSLRCLPPLSWGGLIRGSYHGPHTFFKVSSPIVMGRSEMELLSRPSHLLSKVSSPFIGGRILLQLRCFKVAPKVSTTMWTMGEITVTDYIERECCGILLAILHLDFYVWSFYAFHHCA